tara:strand:+ start:131 stop:1006 length:876 start_codon:yes stop_codon:yes gene_type:complete
MLRPEQLAAAQQLAAARQKKRRDEAFKLADGSYWTGWRELRWVLGVHVERVGGASPMHILPRDLLQHIAKLAHRPRLIPRFTVTEEDLKIDAENSEQELDEIREAVVASSSGLSLTSFIGSSARKLKVPWSSGFQYFDLSFHLYSGTEVTIGSRTLLFEGAWEEGEEGTFSARLPSVGDAPSRHVTTWGRASLHPGRCNTLGLLFNFDLAYVLLSLNGVVGPRVTLSRGTEANIEIDDDEPDFEDTEDAIRVPSRVPMRMADQALHGQSLPARFECLCRGDDDDCVFCRDA